MATRPWQHVLEPLSGYLSLGMMLIKYPNFHGEAFNFGPRAEQNRTVLGLLEDLSNYWGFKQPEEAYMITKNIPFNEAGLLKLNCDKSLSHLEWEPTLDYNETASYIAAWYTSYYKGNRDMASFTCNQLEGYATIAKQRNRAWTK